MNHFIVWKTNQMVCVVLFTVNQTTAIEEGWLGEDCLLVIIHLPS